MPDEVIRREEFTSGNIPESFRRISWGAVWGGVMAALGMEILMVMFGLFIGFVLFSPGTANPTGGLYPWSAAWWLVTTGWSLFFGAWVSAKLSRHETRIGGALHGIVTWGLTSLATFLIMLTITGTAVNQTVGVARTALLAANSAPASTAAVPNQPPAERQAERTLNNPQQAGSVFLNWLFSFSTNFFLFLWLGSAISLCTAILGGGMGGRISPAGTSARPRERLAA